MRRLVAISLFLPSLFLPMLGAIGQGGPSTDVVSLGQAIYSQTCIACHGEDGKGVIPGVQDLSRTDGPLSKSDALLLRSITEGVSSPSAPIAMPPKGGNPTLRDEDMRAVLAFLRAAFSN